MSHRSRANRAGLAFSPAVAWASLLLLLAGRVQAQANAQAPTPAPPRSAARQPEPKDAQADGDHLHDGFYLRFGLGFGSFSATNDSVEAVTGPSGNPHVVPEAKLTGSPAAFDLVAGYAPVPGLVLGAGVFVTGGGNARVEMNGESYAFDGQATLALYGAAVDVFFDPRGGFHLGGGAGGASMKFQRDRTEPRVFTSTPPASGTWQSQVCPEDSTGCRVPDADGLGWTVFGGYDAFVSSNWSMGGYVRMSGFSGEGWYHSEASGWAFALLATALYH